MTLWNSRLGTDPSDALMDFSVSIQFDKRLAKYDIEASLAHLFGLKEVGLVEQGEFEKISEALKIIEEEMAAGSFDFIQTDEDIHTAIERRTIELVGDVGGKLHTGRSRNDQVVTALRLLLKDELKNIFSNLIDFNSVILNRAKEVPDVYLPGYTHLQRAQPILLSHHLLAHGWAFFRDLDRIWDCYLRLDCSSLGAGALGGSTLPLDPKTVKDRLGFKNLFENSLDAVADRDFVAEALFVISMIGIHLSKMGEEIILWTTSEFGFATLDDRYSTGSSMLPQKKNPDIAELARGKSGRLIGNLTGFLATLKSLPLAYNRDLQEDKEPLFDSIDQIKLALSAYCGLYETIEFHDTSMQSAADSAYSVAIDLAEWLVKKGLPFRSAYNLVGSIVKDSIQRHVALPELVLAHPDLGEQAMEIFEPGSSVKRRVTHGSTGVDPVKIQIKNYEKKLNETKKQLLKI